MRILAALLGGLTCVACSDADSGNAIAPSGGGAGPSSTVVSAGTAGSFSMGRFDNGVAGATDLAAAGTDAAGVTSTTAGVAGGFSRTTCETERVQLERAMTKALDAAAADPTITDVSDFTLALEASDGHRYDYSHGNSSLTTVYESASTSKWVSASIILDLVDQGVLSLSDEPSRYLDYWNAPGVTLAQLLSFTSGFSQEVLCFNFPNADFADCVQSAYQANADIAPHPGTAFDYSSTHLQVAGMMAITAAHAEDWTSVFSAWQARTGLFPSAAYDLPSARNPRLAGGMHWNGAEYLNFLRALYSGTILTDATRQAMLGNQRGAAVVVGSPTIDALNQDWAYGFGNWLECRDAIGPNTFDCGAGHRNSSPGAYGAYPFIDYEHHYFGILARQGKLGTFREGDQLFEVIAANATRWADACSGLPN